VLDRGLLAEAQRVDEAHRPRLEAEHVVQGTAGLAQREVQRRRLERTVAIAPGRLSLRRLGPQVERREVVAEAGEYDRVLAAFPDAYLEDPHDLPEIARRLGDHVERVSYDAPIHGAEDIGATPLPARVVNVKPCRIGSLRALLEVYARCARERRPMYGGGMGELGVGRGQIELLAALFHADAPNDVAPSAYNEDDATGGLPASPLAPRPEATGFRWAAWT
jgi:hypothetical protein